MAQPIHQVKFRSSGRCITLTHLQYAYMGRTIDYLKELDRIEVWTFHPGTAEYQRVTQLSIATAEDFESIEAEANLKGRL